MWHSEIFVNLLQQKLNTPNSDKKKMTGGTDLGQGYERLSNNNINM